MNPPYSQKQSVLSQAVKAVLFGCAAFIGILLAMVVLFQLIFSGRVFPGVSVNGIDVGGLTPAKAAERLQNAMPYPTQGRVAIQFGDQTWVASPQELGLFLDPETSASLAYQVGRGGGLFTALQDQFNAWNSGTSVSPALVFDQRIAYLYISNIAAQVDQPVVEANLTLNGVDVQVTAGQKGRAVDIETTLDAVSRQIQTLQDGIVPLVVKETVPAVQDVSKQAELARAILSQPLTLTLPENQPDQKGPWTFEPAALAAMLTIERIEIDGQQQVQVNLSSDTLRAYLTELAPSLTLSPENARFIFNDETRQLEVIKNAVIGRKLNVENSIQTIQQKLAEGQHSIALSFDFTNPKILDTATGADLGITELVSAESSYFYGSSADRIQNIKAAASRFHGLLIAPGETFSMAEALGDISLDNGYAEAMIILNGQTIKGVGGGVCQVSTTLFRTAFFGGYPIVERHAHAYRVSYYERVSGGGVNSKLAGLDATVYVPLVDLKFTNDTPYYILMETYVVPSNYSITWKFYSTSDGRTVNWETSGLTNIVKAPEPLYRENPDLAKGEKRQVDWAADGADVRVTRTVMKNGAVYFTDTISTHYLPWQEVWEYGPGTEGIPTPTPEE